MRKYISFFAADADQWEQDGMSVQDEDALVLALWRWYRGREDKSGLSTVTKVLYSMMVKRLESTEELSLLRSEVGKKGAANRWQNNFANGKGNGKTDGKGIRGVKWPTSTSTSTSTSTTTSSSTSSSSVKERMGDTPMPPACVVTKKVPRFVKPTEQEVSEYCREKGYTKVNAADFIDYYESNGWMVGKNKMKDWKRTVSRWERMDQQGRGGNCAALQAGNNGMPVGMILHTKKDVKASDYE
jgi:hypothetical protein